MKRVEVIKVTSIQIKSDKVRESEQLSSLRELFRREKAAPRTTKLDPIIDHKLTKVYKN
jgi:hypothetical protein